MFQWVKPEYERPPEEWPDDMPKPVRENPVLRQFVWNRMHLHHDNYMGAFCGETGSGKSYAALRMAEVIDPDFSVDQIAFSVEEFLELVIDDSFGPGSMIVFEEASVEAGSDEYMTKKNKALRQVSETWRHQRRGAVFTYPAFKRLDSGVRGRVTGLVQLDSVNEASGYSVGRYKYLQQDSDSGDIYRHFPVIGGVEHRKLKFRLPSDELLNEYEEMKTNYTSEKNVELLESLLDEASETEDDAVDDPEEIAQDILTTDSLEDYIQDNHGQEYIDRDLIELDYGIGARLSKKVKKTIQREVEVSAV